AAVVCRRWTSPALDALWRFLDDLRPLFGLLGGLETIHYYVEEEFWDIQSDVVLSEQSWDTFKSYAARIRRLEPADETVEIAPGLLMRALAHCETGILPNLQGVHWKMDGYFPILNHITAFCPASLRHMSFDFIRDNDDIAWWMERMLNGLTSSPIKHLESFEFKADVPRTSNIEDRFPCGNALVNFIKTQPDLQDLGLLTFEIVDPTLIPSLLQALPRLCSFHVNMENFSKFQMCLFELGQASPSLKRIAIAGPLTSEDETLTKADIESLYQLPLVEELKLWLDCKLLLEVQDIQQMGQAWSRLTSLILYSSTEPGIPLSYLTSFAQWLPLLERLAARFDCTGSVPSADAVAHRFNSLKLLIIIWDQNPPNNSATLAEFLSMVCGPEVDLRVTSTGLRAADVLKGQWNWEFSDKRANKDFLIRMKRMYRVQAGCLKFLRANHDDV
ncbi:hypothetical protein FRB90_003494, partial [Tulasnella sp. 427]